MACGTLRLAKTGRSHRRARRLNRMWRRGIGIFKRPFSSRGIVLLGPRAVKHARPRPGIRAFSGASSGRGAMFRFWRLRRARANGEGRPLLKAKTGAAAFTSTKSMALLTAACERTGLSPDTFGSLLSPEDVADIKAGDIPVATLRAYALSFAENIQIGAGGAYAARSHGTVIMLYGRLSRASHWRATAAVRWVSAAYCNRHPAAPSAAGRFSHPKTERSATPIAVLDLGAGPSGCRRLPAVKVWWRRSAGCGRARFW